MAGNKNLTNYHLVTDAQITAARTARIDNRANQNAKAMVKCIKSSIRGDIRDTIFTQSANIPSDDDGIALFNKLTTFTTIASYQLSLLSFDNILSFNPFDHDFNIPTINTELINLFTLATTQHRTLDDSERIQKTLSTYSKINQPEAWAQWARN